MQGFFTMLKCNLKLLLRNKGYLISVIGIPIISLTWIWFLQYSSTVTTVVTEKSSVTEIGLEDKVLQSESQMELAVKVYDASHSKASEYLLNALESYSIFNFYRVDAAGLTKEEIKTNATETAQSSNLFTSLYIPANFEENMRKGYPNQVISIYLSTEDERAQLLLTCSKELVKTISSYGNATNHDLDTFQSLLSKLENTRIKKEVATVSNTDLVTLNEEQKLQKDSFGYVLGFFSLSFLLSGVFISSIYVKEKNNNVLKRVTITKANFINYISVKVVLAVITLILEEVVICIGMHLLGDSIGLSTFQFVFVTSGVGMVLLLLTIAVGTYTNNVVTVAFGGFFAWTISNCLAGLYFPLSESSAWLQALARLMPQYWSMKFYTLVTTGSGSGYLMYLAVCMAFIVLIGCLGVLGLKLNSKK